MARLINTLKVLLFFAGLVLLCLNVLGLFIPLRSTEVYGGGAAAKGGALLTEEQLLAAASRRPGETDGAYLSRLNRAVNEGILHYWEDEGARRYNLRIPPYENYLLFVAGYLYPSEYAKYEYCDYRRAIRRGVGLCSQQAIILAGLLNEHGVETMIVGLRGHVVVRAQVDKEKNLWWVADPDYGVTIDRDIREIESDPALVRPYYAGRGYDEETVNVLVGAYGPEGNRVYRGAPEYRFWKVYYLEYLSYVLIWIIPIMLMLPYLWPRLAKLARLRSRS